MKYEVKYGGEIEGKDDEFMDFDMRLASGYVQRCIVDKMKTLTTKELEKIFSGCLLEECHRMLPILS